MKLFLWENVLVGRSCIHAFAIADTVEEAKEMLVKKGLGERHWDGTCLKEVRDSASDGSEPKAPKVCEGKVAHYLYGG